MSEEKNKIKLFEEKQVRTIWDEDEEKWWFSVVDICAVLVTSTYYNICLGSCAPCARRNIPHRQLPEFP